MFRRPPGAFAFVKKATTSYFQEQKNLEYMPGNGMYQGEYGCL